MVHPNRQTTVGEQKGEAEHQLQWALDSGKDANADGLIECPCKLLSVQYTVFTPVPT